MPERKLLPFQNEFIPASFRNVRFHCEVASRESGRRTVTHEFPKKELPYSEDLGRAARKFTLRVYYATYAAQNLNIGAGLSAPQLDYRYRLDYREGRDALLTALEVPGPGTLMISTFKDPLSVNVARYRVTEEEKLGGYTVFEIEFVEFGLPPQYITPNANFVGYLSTAANSMLTQTQQGYVQWTSNESGPPPTNNSTFLGGA